MSADSLETDVASVSEAIAGELALGQVDRERSDNRKESLYSAGIDPVVAAIALKVVLGIAASFLGRLFYDAWKAARTREHLDSLAEEITGRLAGELPSAEAVDTEKLRGDVLGVLTLEGLSEAQAKAVFDQAIAIVGDRFRH